MTSDFLAPGRLWLLVVVVLLGVAYLAAARWRRVAQVRFTRVDLLDEVAPHRPGWRRHVVAVLQLVAIALAVVATARPVHRSTERTTSEGRILLLLDVSLSMMATDVEPDRLSAAQEAARDFIAEVDADVEVGLISFSGVVDVEVAPTLDRDRLIAGIDGLELAESTAIGDALAAGTNVLVDEAADAGTEPDETDATDEDAPAPGAIVLMSDGETTVGRPTEAGADIAAAAGVPVFTIAFGTPDGTISDPASGDSVPVPVSPAALEDVAERTSGASYEAATESELADAYDQIRDSLGETLGDEIEIVSELTWRWALGAFVVLAVAWSLGLWWLRGML